MADKSSLMTNFCLFLMTVILNLPFMELEALTKLLCKNWKGKGSEDSENTQKLLTTDSKETALNSQVLGFTEKNSQS